MVKEIWCGSPKIDTWVKECPLEKKVADLEFKLEHYAKEQCELIEQKQELEEKLKNVEANLRLIEDLGKISIPSMFERFRFQMEAKFNKEDKKHGDSWKSVGIVPLYDLLIGHAKKAYTHYLTAFGESLGSEYNRDPIKTEELELDLVDVANYCVMIVERLREK